MSNLPDGCTDEHVDAQFLSSYQEAWLEEYCLEHCEQTCINQDPWLCEAARQALAEHQDNWE